MTTIRLDKNKAIDLLNTAMEEARTNSRYQGIIEFGEALIEKLNTAAPYKERLAAWHTAVAAGLADESISITSNGNLSKDAPAKPKLEATEIIKDLSRSGHRRAHDAYAFEGATTVAQVQKIIDSHKAAVEDSLSGYKAQIAMFELSADDVIEVDQGNFFALTSGRNQRGFY